MMHDHYEMVYTDDARSATDSAPVYTSATDDPAADSEHSNPLRDVGGEAVCSQPAEPMKSPPATRAEFEAAMRALGYSARQAKKLTAGGWPAYSPESQSQDIAALAELLRGRRDGDTNGNLK